ncbi:hypothetical protein [Parahaliea mediterranea]|uniref:PEP-CTERM sorting domain-containing protein n=1 Tax=Parahaliea mediterranea TaxID=651086 RepID=A0A939IKV9_9GAMM|nr:hypothetical protein [Parahaliea mediterranea]MBN7799199.1 hypothetical protein [Parahaliea mediterranea]
MTDITPPTAGTSLRLVFLLAISLGSATAAGALNVDFETYPNTSPTNIGDTIATTAFSGYGISYIDTTDSSLASFKPTIVDGATYGMSGHAVISKSGSTV